MVITSDNNRSKIPPGWSKDDLSNFINMTQENLHASFHNKKQAYKQLSDIDGCFMKIAGNLINPQDKIAPIFLLRSHSAYRAMCALALSGQIIEAFALGRLCIEYAGYGILINSNQNNFSVWFDKSRSRRHKKAFSDAFTQAKVRGCIDKHDKKLAEVYQQLYERCIDAGAHPNGLAVSGSMKITDDPDADLTHIEQIYLHRDGLAMDHGQKSAAQIGICSLHIFQFIFKERFSLLGLTNLLQELRQGL